MRVVANPVFVTCASDTAHLSKQLAGDFSTCLGGTKNENCQLVRYAESDNPWISICHFSALAKGSFETAFGFF